MSFAAAPGMINLINYELPSWIHSPMTIQCHQALRITLITVKSVISRKVFSARKTWPFFPEIGAIVSIWVEDPSLCFAKPGLEFWFLIGHLKMNMLSHTLIRKVPALYSSVSAHKRSSLVLLDFVFTVLTPLGGSLLLRTISLNMEICISGRRSLRAAKRPA